MSQNILISAAIFIFIVVRFLMRELRERHLSTTQLFVLPGIVGALALVFVGTIASMHPARIGELALEAIACIAVGIAVGFAVAHFTTVRTGQGGRIFFRGSYATVAIWIGALVLRFLARFALARAHSPVESEIANAALIVLIASALMSMRLLVRRKAISERLRGSTITETAI